MIYYYDPHIFRMYNLKKHCMLAQMETTSDMTSILVKYLLDEEIFRNITLAYHMLQHFNSNSGFYYDHPVVDTI